MADTELQKQLNELKTDMNSLKTDMAGLMTLLKELGTDKVDDVKSALEEELRSRREDLRRRLGEAGDYGRHTVSSIEESIEQRPLSSVLTAFLVGFFASKWMSSGERR